MGVDAVRPDFQSVGEGLGCQAICDELQDFKLTGGKFRNAGLIGEALLDFRTDDALALGDGADGGDELGVRRILDERPRGSGVKCALHLVGFAECRQDEDLCRYVGLCPAGRRRKSV